MTIPILVTGGAGYIGSHTCKALASAGYAPITYDNLSRGSERAVRWGPLERGDVLDGARVRAVLQRHHPEAVMHFAAAADVAESIADPALYYRENVMGALTLLEAMHEEGVQRFIFSSSCATYGVPEHAPIDEDAPQQPINPYGRTKLVIEFALRDYAAAYGFSAAALRYFNAAGADPDGEIGGDHDPETHLIPLVLDAAATGAPIGVFGDDYPTPDGTCIRDYIHVSDLADAHVLACGLLERDQGFSAFNLGTGEGLSVRQIIEAARRRTGRDIRERIEARRPGDPPMLTANAARAAEVLQWRPRRSGVDEIIDTAWRWRQRRSAQPRTQCARVSDDA